MIRSIDGDYGAAAVRDASTGRTAGAAFADVFASLAAPPPPAPPARTGAADRGKVEAASTDKLDEALAAFRKELSMTPAERVRRDVLKSMDLTEAAIEALPPKERTATEEKVAMEVARRMKIMQGGSGRAPVPVIGGAGSIDIR